MNGTRNLTIANNFVAGVRDETSSPTTKFTGSKTTIILKRHKKERM